MKRNFFLLAGPILFGVVLGTQAEGAAGIGGGAQAPALKINGFTSVNAVFSNQRRIENGKGGAQPHIAIGTSDLYFTVSGKAANGMGYKYLINFESIPGAKSYVNKNYVQVDGKFGTIQGGDVSGPESSMPKSGSDLVGGTGGIDGAMNGVYNYSAGVIKGVNFIGTSKKATKVVFYSPTVLGVQLGIAYTPNTSHAGSGEKNNVVGGSLSGAGNSSGIYPDSKDSPFGTRNLVVGVTYKKNGDTWSYELAAVGVVEKSTLTSETIRSGVRTVDSQTGIPLHNARSYQLSSTVGFGKWKVGAGWIDNGKSRLPKEQTALLGDSYLGNAGKAWNIGTSYTVGAYQFATAYHRTDRKTDAKNSANSDIVVATVDVNALQGLKVYGEVDLVRTRTNADAKDIQQANLDLKGTGNQATGNNSGAILAVGVKASF